MCSSHHFLKSHPLISSNQKTMTDGASNIRHIALSRVLISDHDRYLRPARDPRQWAMDSLTVLIAMRSPGYEVPVLATNDISPFKMLHNWGGGGSSSIAVSSKKGPRCQIGSASFTKWVAISGVFVHVETWHLKMYIYPPSDRTGGALDGVMITAITTSAEAG